MICVLLESPYQGDLDLNTRYARAALADSLSRGEAPIASHMLYTQPGVLDDSVPAERRRGIAAGHAWMDRVDNVVAYADLGVSTGMWEGIARAVQEGKSVEYRHLGGEWAAPLPRASVRDWSPPIGRDGVPTTTGRGRVQVVSETDDGLPQVLAEVLAHHHDVDRLTIAQIFADAYNEYRAKDSSDV